MSDNLFFNAEIIKLFRRTILTSASLIDIKSASTKEVAEQIKFWDATNTDSYFPNKERVTSFRGILRTYKNVTLSFIKKHSEEEVSKDKEKDEQYMVELIESLLLIRKSILNLNKYIEKCV